MNDSSEDSDDVPIPVMLGIRLAEQSDVRKCLREMLAPTLGGPLPKKMNSTD